MNQIKLKRSQFVDDLSNCTYTTSNGNHIKTSLPALMKLMKAIRGIDLSWDDLLLAGERIFNLKRMFDIRCGITKKDDILPNRLAKEPLPDGGAAGKVPDMDKLLPAYYKIRGWSDNGIPTDATLKKLDLNVD